MYGMIPSLIVVQQGASDSIRRSLCYPHDLLALSLQGIDFMKTTKITLYAGLMTVPVFKAACSMIDHHSDHHAAMMATRRRAIMLYNGSLNSVPISAINSQGEQ